VFSGSLGALTILALALPAMADLRIIPTLAVSERYDTNVLFTQGGQNRQDFVTSLSPGLNASYKGRPLEATLSGGLNISSYAKNTNFNHVSAFGTASADLTQLIGRLDKRARLQVTGSVAYTPELPAFVSATVGLNPFANGLQPQRVRSFTNSLSIAGGYTLTSRVNLSGNYSYSYVNFGNTIGAAPQTALFQTTFQNLTAGPNITLSRTDTLSLLYLYQRADYGGDIGGFHTQGGTAGLTHTFSRQLTGTVSAGLTKITPSERVAPVVSLSASWREKNTSMTISFSRSVSPSFLIAASALNSNVLTASASQALTGSLSGSVGVTYAHSTGVSGTSTGASGTTTPASSLSFDSLGTNLSLSYAINRSLVATFSYMNTHFKQESFNISSNFHRDVVMFSLSASWM
jgi:hypothetical protein